MKVLFINPRYSRIYSKVITATGINPPVGLACIASYLRENGVEVSILDANALQIPFQNLKKHIPKDFDIVGVSSYTPSVDLSIKTLELAREINPNCKTIMGGSHITGDPVGTMKRLPVIDVGVCGEGEITILELINTFKNNKELSSVKGIIYRKADNLKITDGRPLIKNLDILPIPAYDLLPMDKYCLPAHHTSCGGNISIKPFTLLMTSRGCPYDCTFCASKVVWGRKVRYRSPELVLSEISCLIEKYKIKTFEIVDDCFILNKKRLRVILDSLSKDYDIRFNCLNRVDCVDREILLKLKKAGCYLIRFGVESGSQKILNEMKKGISVEQIKNAFKLCKEINIPANASFILGMPGETIETVDETIALAKEINPAIIYIFFAMPLVGTELREEALTQKLILNDNWETWESLDQPIIRTYELSYQELINLKKEFYNSFYYRPKYLIDKLCSIRGYNQIKHYLKGFVAVRNLKK